MNFILVIADTFRKDHLGCYGNKWISTPYLDKFAKRSVVFDNAYAGSFPTVPNRRDVLTGRAVFTYADWGRLPSDEVVLPELLGEKGYTSMMVADTPHILQSGYNFDRGFNGWQWIRGQENDRLRTDPEEVTFPCKPEKLRTGRVVVEQYLRNVSDRTYEEDYFVAKTMREAARWLEKNYKRDKFFLYVDTFDPHEPWDPPKHYLELYEKGYEGEEVIYPIYGDASYLTKKELAHVRALYAGEVSLVDRWVGMLLERIEDLGLFDNTLVIFTTDHGFYHGEHGMIGKLRIDKGKMHYDPLYREVADIPLIAAVPGTSRGRRVKGFAQPWDMAPTMLELAGARISPSVQGKSLAPVLKGKKRAVRNFAVSSPSIIHGPNPFVRSTVSTSRWTLIYGGQAEEEVGTVETAAVDSRSRRMERAKPGEAKPELYDITSDPDQRHNVIGKNHDVARRLHGSYVKFLEEVGTSEEHMRARREI